MEQKSKKTQGKNKNKISIGGGGGIGGVVVWGGALAVAGLIAVFATKISRKRASCKNPTTFFPSKEFSSCGTEGLRFILQTSSPYVYNSPCCRNYGKPKIGVTQIDSSELVSTQSLILEEKPDCDLHSDYSKPESLASRNDYGIGEAGLLQVLDKQSLIKESMNKNYCTEELTSMEPIGEIKEDAIHAEQLAIEEKYPSKPSVEEEEVGDECIDEDEEYIIEKGEECKVEDEKYVVKKGEDSSEGTEDSSMECNAEQIWPAYLIEELSLKLEEIKINLQNPQEKIEEDTADKIEEYADFNNSAGDGSEKECGVKNSMMILNKKETGELLTGLNQPAGSPNLRIWIWSVLLLMLVLLLLLSHYDTISYHLLDRVSFLVQ